MKTVFINGSPKKKLSVSSYLLGIVRLLVRGEVVSEQVRNVGDHERVLKSIKDAENVVFGMPLYVDGVPSHMLSFMKEMEKFCTDNNIHLNVYLVSNGGFIEGSQNRALMQVMENFSKRCYAQCHANHVFSICRAVCVKYSYVRIKCSITDICRTVDSCFVF